MVCETETVQVCVDAGVEEHEMRLDGCNKPPFMREFERGRRGRRFIQMQRDVKYRSFFSSLWGDDDVDFAFDIVIGCSSSFSPKFVEDCRVVDSGCI
jgi:hypothetical protein